MGESIPGENTQPAKLRHERGNDVLMKCQSLGWLGGHYTKAVKFT